MSENWKTKHLHCIRGIPIIKSPWFPKKNIEDSADLVAKDGDIVLISYPKTGTHLLMYIVLQIISNGKSFPNIDELRHKFIPSIDSIGISAIEMQKKPRIYRQHMPFSVIKKNDNAKYVYIYRRPEDTLVSYYYYTQTFINEDIPLENFIDDFLAGDVLFGSYFKHVSSCMSHKGDPNMCLMTYEKLMSDRRGEILRLAKFLGDEYYSKVAGDESTLNAIIENTSFESMQSRLTYDIPNFDVLKSEEIITNRRPFFRKGLVGDGLQLLSADQMKRLRDAMEQQIEDEQLIEEWRL